MHDSAVVTVSDRARASARTIASTGRSSSAKSCCLKPVAKQPLERRATLLGTFVDVEVDVDLEVPGADGHLDPVPVPSGLVECPGHGRLARPEEAQDPMVSRTDPLENRRERVAPDGGRPEPPQLARRPGKRDGDAPGEWQEDTGSRPGETERDRVLGQRSLLADARREVGVRSSETPGELA